MVALALAAHSLGAPPSDYISPSDVVAAKDGKTIYIAESDGGRVSYMDTSTGRMTASVGIEGSPSGLALSADGGRLYATAAEPEGKVYVIDTASGKVQSSIPVGHTPMSPVLSKDGGTLYVCNRFDNDISVVDLESKRETARIPATREPVALVLSLDGKHLYVANHLPQGAANVDSMTSVIEVIDTDRQKVVKSIPLPNGAIDLRDIGITPDGQYVLVPSIFARFLVPTTQIERGWMNTHALNLIDTRTQTLYTTVLLDDPNRGAANPWGVGCTEDGRYICVAHSATHEVSMIDREALLNKLRESEREGIDPANQLGFLAGLRRRIGLKGNHPRNIAVAGKKVYVAEHLSDSIGVIEIQDNGEFAVEQAPIGETAKPDLVRMGEIYFNDAALCFQHWQSCTTCHPDARMDAINWDLLNDGIGNPKNTKSMLFSHVTPPAMITGIRASAEAAVRAGIKYIQFAVPEEKKAQAIDAYLKSLRPVPSPYLENGKLSVGATRGKKIFEGKAACAKCHSGEYYTDLRTHDVGVGDGMEQGREFDTPTLIEVWRTAPYLYDGRAATLKDVFTEYNQNDRHGKTSALSERELNDLLDYVNSL